MSVPSNLIAAVAALGRARVLVVGDVILDRYQFGAPTRVSREAPVLVLEAQGERSMPGGAANAAANAGALGRGAVLAGVAGDDSYGNDLQTQLLEAGIDTHLVREMGRLTTTKTRIFAGTLARGQQVVRLDQADPAPTNAATRAALRGAVRSELASASAVLFSDYGYGSLDPGEARAMVKLATAAGLPVVADSQADLLAYRGATVLTPNLAELERYAGRHLTEDAGVVAAAAGMRRKADATAVLCTRGGEGMTLVTEDAVLHLPVAQRTEVFDVAGAGDTVAAALAVGLGAGLSLPLAAVLADAAASVVVQKLGPATCSPAELRAALKRLDPAVLSAIAVQ
ncbi:MAG: bifunctional heptose 7-phosphate kinase/heptose 1-phosphate adenyltransferase [Candidatus Dormibacteria bacterium]